MNALFTFLKPFFSFSFKRVLNLSKCFSTS